MSGQGAGDEPLGPSARAAARMSQLSATVAAVRRWAAPVTSTVTPLGRTILGIAGVAWLLGSRLGWVELRVTATAGLLLFALCGLLTVGRTQLSVEVELDPERVVVGTSAAGRVNVTNLSRARLLPIALELPIGDSAFRFNLPSLGSGASHDELYVVSTERRGVIAVGPATTVRGDPLGLLRRTVPWTDAVELFVHPLTVPLGSFGSGLLRDLEGQTSNDLSMSDLAFHALRDYSPGDDRRHIHWRSSAKIGSSVPGGKFLVRQFLDTRRSHLTVIVDGAVSAYDDPGDFETAVSVAASVAVQAIRDEIETTVVVADQAADGTNGRETLDRFSAANFGAGGTITELAHHAASLAPDSSIVLLVTGARTDFRELRRAAMYFSSEVSTTGLRIDTSRPVGMAGGSDLRVLNLPHLGDLAPLLAGGGLQ